MKLLRLGVAGPIAIRAGVAIPMSSARKTMMFGGGSAASIAFAVIANARASERVGRMRMVSDSANGASVTRNPLWLRLRLITKRFVTVLIPHGGKPRVPRNPGVANPISPLGRGTCGATPSLI
ncbi:MAG: hypothetical protein R3F11_06785 [Verrucomicrobiales bacterium]